MTEEVRTTDRDGVRWIELDRPESRNGLTVDVNRKVITALREVEGRDETRVIVLTGAGGNFCSGLDLKDAVRRGPISADQIEIQLREVFHGLIRSIRAVSLPVVAAVDGAAVGFGCDLALACDLRLVSERASFAELFVRRGLMPDGGSTFSLPRLIGVGRALELLFTGDSVDAEQALRFGLANRMFANEEFEPGVFEFAKRLANGPPLVHRAIKQCVYASLEGGLDEALDREARNQVQILRSADFAEGIAAFLAKRAPVFRGR